MIRSNDLGYIVLICDAPGCTMMHTRDRGTGRKLEREVVGLGWTVKADGTHRCPFHGPTPAAPKLHDTPAAVPDCWLPEHLRPGGDAELYFDGEQTFALRAA
jgi:hypothetical protein